MSNLVRFFYLRNGRVPHACVAFKVVDNAIMFGLSSCSKHDEFTKKLAREIALTRLNNKSNVILLNNNCKNTFMDNVKTIMNNLSDSHIGVVRKLSKKWLKIKQ